MKVVIPMAGSGTRFVESGYTDPKPLVRLHDLDGGKTRILDHVVQMFRPTDNLVFICNHTHLATTNMRMVIRATYPDAEIVAMPAHKLGPVQTVAAACEEIYDDEPVIVAYCDGAIKWDQGDFEHYVVTEGLDGCILTHTGFHPHTLNNTKMAFLRTDAGSVLQVKEKESFTDHPENEHASSGVYYFRTGRMLKKYFDMARHENVNYNGEFYVTLVYNLMIRDGLKVGYYDTTGVAILGTPAEVQNFEAWSVILRGDQIKSEADLLKCYDYWKRYHGAV